jgi:hypothetical protein
MPYIGKEPARVPVTAADIPDDSITAAKILDGVITAADIGAGAVDTSELAADAVEGSKIADNAIGSEHIASGSVDNAHLASGIDATKLTGTVATARLGSGTANNAVFLRGDNTWVAAGSTSASDLTSGTLANARLPSNISDAGTEGTKIAVGTTAQRGSTQGQWRFNTTTGFFEGYDGTSFSSLELTPVVSSVDDGEVDSAGGGNQTIVVTGQNFSSGGVISFVGSSASFNAATTTFNNTTQVTAVAPKSSFLNAQEPYKVKFTSVSNKVGESAVGLINVDNAPAWSTAVGSVGNVLESVAITNIQLTATDPDSDAVTYAETTSNLSGSGFALSSAGVLSGTPSAVGSDTTTSFTVRATANSKTTDRAFSIVTKNLTTSALLWDATSVGNWDFSESTNGPGLFYQGGGAITGVTTAVTMSNIDGASGNLANINLKADSTRMYTHYNNPNLKNIGNTLWSTSISGHTVSNNSGWWGIYTGSGEAKIWTTYDAGANPSFKFRRLTGEWTWRSGSMVFTIYGTNNISAVNDGATFSNTNLTQLFTVTNHTAQTFDTGYWTGDFYRYYVFHLTGSGSGFDWGLDMCKWYGDYY